MHFLTLGLIALLLTIPRPVWSQQVKCDALPAGSLSRLECERTQQRLDREQREGTQKKEWSTLPPNTLSAGYRSMDPDSLWANASALVGEKVIVRGLALNRILDRGEATFGTPGDHEVMVSGIPSSVRLGSSGNDFILLGLGVTRGTNAYGGTVTVPKFRFLGQP